MELSETQRLAVETVGKNVCVSAGAGSGKTRVLVERFLHLVTCHQISPQAILAITFTEKAANEMKRRIVTRLRAEGLEEARREVENAAIGTIHSFAARLLREHPIEAGVDPHFVILESAESGLLQERALDETIETLVAAEEVFNLLHLYGEKGVREGILEAYRCSRNSEASFEEILKRRTQASRKDFERALKENLAATSGVKGQEEVQGALLLFFEKDTFSLEEIEDLMALKGKLRAAGKPKEAIRQVQETILDFASFLREEITLPQREVFVRLALQFEKTYEKAKRRERSLDFDDLQLRAVRLLGAGSPASKVLGRIYQGKFREILVDEFQDTNHLQNRLLELVRRESNLFVVGDFKQSIYGFRGTQVEIFLEKEKAFQTDPHGSRVSLAENYRTRPRLIDFVNGFFETLWKEDNLPFEPLQATRPEEGTEPGVAWLRLKQEKGESLDEVRIREARTLARHVQALVKEAGFQYREIAFLFEALTHVHFYEQELRRAEIPYFVVSNRGFYSQPEIRDVVTFLFALENPKRDVSLAAALRSPLFQVSDETLFWLARHAKKESDETPLAEGLGVYESIAEISEGEKEKLRFFKTTSHNLLEEKERLRIAELIEKILRITSFDLYVLKLRQGERRLANLRKLVEVAREMESKGPLPLGDFVRAVKGLETREVRESQAQVEAEEGNVVRLMSIHMAKGLEFPVVFLPDLGRGEKTEGGRFLVSEKEGLGLEGTLTFRRNKKRLERFRSEESKRLLYVAMTRAKERLVLSGPHEEGESKESFHEMSSWAEWVGRILGEGNGEVRILSEAEPGPFPFERRKPLAERKSIRRRLESLSPLPLRKPSAEIERIFDSLTPPEKVYFQRIDLPVSAFLLFAKDPEAYFQVYEIGIPDEERTRRPLEVKDEEEREEEELTSAQFGTRVHQILEQFLVRRLGLRDADRAVHRFTQDLGPKEREEISEMVRRFARSEEAQEIFKAEVFYPELPFVLRLPHGLVQGTLDLVYRNRKGEWIILDYKTSVVDERTLAQRGEEYRVQLELYALALGQILGCPPVQARIHFLRPGLIYPIPFDREGFEALWKKFTDLQKEILNFREGLLR